MVEVLKLNLTLHGIHNASSSEKMEAIKCIQLLRADLKGFESVTVLPENTTDSMAGEMGIGSLVEKGIGPLVIGVLSTEVQGETVAVKVARSLLSSMQGKQRQSYKLQLSRKRVDGSEDTIIIEGPASSHQEMMAIFNKAEEFITGQT